MPRVDLSFMSQGAEVIRNHILIIGGIIILVIGVQLIIYKLIRMPRWLEKIMFTCVTIGVFALVVVSIYIPGIATKLGLN
ncbi:hypothetical protein [Lysinibacillus halotolerans]|uniref:Uncharacterized protein n=1 Tax=Lysinibacillus halotolerans TaxID=1368476 RepID=A0A3M8HD15_9BACI|nr:hypothetical protein [Lysinibacillus halotolerans]RND00262.1 hypothetical protein EC501_05670 [Lysinibacillus halotolerans]